VRRRVWFAAAVAGQFLLMSKAPAVEPNPLSALAPDLVDRDGAIVIAFEPWSSRLAVSEGAKLDRLAELLRRTPGARLQILVANVNDGALQRFLAARLAVVDGELARRGYAAQTVRQDRSTGIGQVVALRLVVPEPPAMPVQIPVETVASPLPAASTGGPQSILPSSAAAAPPPPEPPPPPASLSAPPPAPPPPPPPPAPPPVVVQEVWTAPAGRQLKAVLDDWAGRAGWTLVWQSDHDYPLEASASFTGDFTDAAQQLVAALATVAPAPFANFYKGNRVLVVHTGEGR